MSQKDLVYKKENNRAYIIINREQQKNSISMKAVDFFLEYLDKAKNDDQVKVVCVTASGEKIFCSGADLAGGLSSGSDKNTKAFQNYARLLTKISQFPKPTVAKVNGHCMAGGTGFMLACDIVLARDNVKFGTPEVNVGLFPMMIGALIFRNVLRKKAMEMILLGEKLSADQAYEMGLVTRIYPPENFEEEVEKILKSLSLKSPIGMKIGKQAFNAIDTMPLEEAVNFLSEKLADVASTDDAVEGITAFIEKRAPKFTGK